MHILVTGGAGYIGSHVVMQLLEKTPFDVTVIDNLSTGHQSTMDTLEAIALTAKQGDLRFYKADLADFKTIEKIFLSDHFDGVLHFAASTSVAESVSEPLKYYMNNTVNTTNLIRLCTTYGVNRFIFSSTAAVYGEPDTIPIAETAPASPINPYGMSKLMSETVLLDAASACEAFHFVILRYFNAAGADLLHRIGEHHLPETHLIPLILKTALGKREAITVFGNDYDTPDGTCIRDYIHVEDLASAHLKALEYLIQNGTSEIFNCGYGHGFSVREVIDTVKTVSGTDFSVIETARRPGDPAILVADNAKIKTILQWNPEHDDLIGICQSAMAWERQLP